MESLSIKAYQHIWSAIHQPHLKDHSGQAILNLLISNGSEFQKHLFLEFAAKRSTGNTETILVEIQNILFSNQDLVREVKNAIKAGKNAPLMPLPDVRLPFEEESTFTRSSNYNLNILIGAGMIALGIILSYMSESGIIRIGLIIFGFSKAIKGLARY